MLFRSLQSKIALHPIANFHMYTTRRIKVWMLKSTITKELKIENQFPFISQRQKGNHIRGVLLCGVFFFPFKMHCSNEVVVHYNCLFQTAYSILRVLIKTLLKCYLWWAFCDVSSSPIRKGTKGMDAASLQGYSSSPLRPHLSGSDRDVCSMALSLS